MTDRLSTDTTLSSIALSDILDGGPGKDGIPAIDNPSFLTIQEVKGANFLQDDTL